MAVEFRSPKKFAIEIESLVQKDKLSYMDAILTFCETRNIEPDTIAKLISKPLREKLEVEATNLNFLPRTGKLPI